MKKRDMFIGLILAISIGGIAAGIAYDTKAPVKATETTKTVAKPVETKPVEFTPLTPEVLLAAVNAERAKVGVQPLIMDERLNQSAQAKADDMHNRNYKTHVDAEGKQGYDYIPEYAPGVCRGISENLRTSGDLNMSMGSNAVMVGWIQSEPHYKAMIDSRNVYTGFGISGGAYVEHFCIP